jgi:hypothetical protein
MKALYEAKNELLHDCMLTIFACGTIGIAIKLVTFVNQWVFFPSFPNALDSAFLISATAYFAWASRSRRKKHQLQPELEFSMNPAFLEARQSVSIEEAIAQN